MADSGGGAPEVSSRPGSDRTGTNMQDRERMEGQDPERNMQSPSGNDRRQSQKSQRPGKPRATVWEQSHQRSNKVAL